MDAFESAVASAPRLRRQLTLGEDRGPFVVAGDPAGWAAAADDLARAGERVVAYHDLRLESWRVAFRGRPVWRGRRSGPLARYPVVLAGPPHKKYFDGASPAVGRCLLHQPLKAWQQRAGHDPELRAHADVQADVWRDLADEASRKTYAAALRARAEGDAGYFRVSPYREYGHPLVRARPGDTVIDAGAFRGSSAARFSWQMRGRGTVVALEPSLAAYRRLARLPLPGLVPLCVGAWDSHDVLRFETQGASSKVAADGGSTIHVAPIDAVVEDLGLERVDLIKLDVEGAERQALAGAEATLRRFRPKVLLSVYHRRDDLWELPRTLRALCPRYRFYLGHHGPYHTETDIYATPE